MNLIQMSAVAGILILGIVLFRSLFLHRLPKKVMIFILQLIGVLEVVKLIKWT